MGNNKITFIDLNYGKEEFLDYLQIKRDEYDIVVVDEAYNEYLKSEKKSRPIEELWEELKL